MRAAWYEHGGSANEVLNVGEMETPSPGPGEVLVRVHASGINAGDTKKRADWMGLGVAYPRVIPHSDGARVIEEAGEGVSASWAGERVWVWGAQSGRPFGTAAEYVTVSDEQAVVLSEGVGFGAGACLGIPARTAHRCVFADGPVEGKVGVCLVPASVENLRRPGAVYRHLEELSVEVETDVVRYRREVSPVLRTFLDTVEELSTVQVPR